MNKELIVSCPTCKKSVAWNDQYPYKPFCSERCRLIDLGEWADEQKRIPGEDAHIDENQKPQDY
ncbi:DNA gyrase inhibitor YacG [Pleionea sp. CnH1-48]|uniref:DNA gyrase inhibitor YacG n=1 Tax=Pleionea sp. CnH1-48 TaxID=2954494 RepID=UPI002098265C|nr:DNA gyrase inhibitor YacG [Pleionea sp. CnH1-48]MCO7223981.1 DNA gyrase inhibitor YacG [Pleionea sp. CnH1-48]